MEEHHPPKAHTTNAAAPTARVEDGAPWDGVFGGQFVISCRSTPGFSKCQSLLIPTKAMPHFMAAPPGNRGTGWALDSPFTTSIETTPQRPEGPPRSPPHSHERMPSGDATCGCNVLVILTRFSSGREIVTSLTRRGRRGWEGEWKSEERREENPAPASTA